MTEVFRVVLILVSIGTWVYIAFKLKKAQIDTHDVIFWLLFAGILIVLSLFPKIADEISWLLGIYSPDNFVFLVIIFALLIRVFMLNIRISQIEHRFMDYVEEITVREQIKIKGQKK